MSKFGIRNCVGSLKRLQKNQCFEFYRNSLELKPRLVSKELPMAGDVELNPGPYPPGLFIIVKFQYWSTSFEIPLESFLICTYMALQK